MTPDTTFYMIAGFTVIFTGIVIYVVSLVLRNNAAVHQMDLLTSSDEEDTSNHG